MGEPSCKGLLMSPLTAWENFYVIVGSSAGALTGLLFVVISLTAGRRTQATSWGVAAYTTPTVVHFSMTLAVAAVLSAPWPEAWLAAIPLGLIGIGGIVYETIATQRIRRQVNYAPVWEDWLFFVLGPFTIYIALVVAALFLPSAPTPALFGAGGAILLLLVIGIHNAWDLVTYIAIELIGPKETAAGQGDQGKERNPQD
jgi:hypothetical protein